MINMNKEIRLSPSAINTFFRCPRLFYYNYMLKERGPFNIHLYKGNFVHKALEDLFAISSYPNTKEFVANRMEMWKAPDYLFDTEEEKKFHKLEATKMIESFVKRFEEKLDMVMLEGKARDVNHAWNLCKPRLREHKIYDKENHIVGIIDSIETNFDEEVYLVDYKTSKLYKNTISSDYIRQLKLYAYLYRKEFGKLPNYVAVNYLRYGEVFVVPIDLISETVIDSAVDDINHVRANCVSTEIEDYPACNNDWCDCNTIKERLEKKSVV